MDDNKTVNNDMQKQGFMNWDELKTKVDVLNKLVMTLAIAVAAAWALYTFNRELRHENAIAQLQKIAGDIKAQEREVIEVAIDAKALPRLENEYHVEVNVIFYNNGTIDAQLSVKDNSLRITPIKTPGLPEQPTLKKVQFRPLPLITSVKEEPTGELAAVNSIFLPAGGRNSLLYLAQVDQPGRFLVEFNTERTMEDGTLDSTKELTGANLIDVPR